MFEPLLAQETQTYTAQPIPQPAPNLLQDAGINTPTDFGIIGAIIYAVWKQHEMLAVLKHSDEILKEALKHLEETNKVLKNIVDSHERRLDLIEGRNPERRKIE